MALSQVITFGGSPDQLVWKYGDENITTTSQLIVDADQEALLVVNGQDADLFGPGTHTLSLPNIPILNKITQIPTGGVNPFPCKVFYVKKIHQMNILWGTLSPIALNDPEYDIFLHVGLHGSITFSVDNTRKFLLKMVGLRKDYNSDMLIQNFRNQISRHVKNVISTIMLNHKVGYFSLEPHLMDISDVVKVRLDAIFEEYGLAIHFFDIEGVDVPASDYDLVSAAKERRAGRVIEGYDWNTEKKMEILKAFAENQGTMGSMGGMMGGMVGGMAMGGVVSDMVSDVFKSGTHSIGYKDVASAAQDVRNGGINARELLNQQPQTGFTGNNGGFGVSGGFDVDSDFASAGAPPAFAPPPPPVPNVSYHVVINNQAAGPFDGLTLSQMYAAGQITKESFVWKNGMANWVPLNTVSELSFLYAPPIPPVPPIPNMPPMPPIM